MKTTLIIEIETADNYEVFPEEGQTMDDFIGKEHEVKEFREEYTNMMHNELVSFVKKHLEENILDDYMDSLEELYIDGWDSAEDYNIKIKIKNNEEKKIK